MNSTWQVDTLLTDSSELNSCQDVIWIHVKVRNTNPHPIAGYWWTNIGVKLKNETKNRVLLPADYAIISGKKLSKVPFPFFDENIIDTCGLFEPGIRDHSYPSNYYNAHENFIRTTVKSDRSWMSLHHGDGSGMLHSQTKQLDGRKYWVWGSDVHDVARMDFLSSPGNGRYIVKTISALDVDAEKVAGAYADAVKYVNQTVENRCQLQTFMSMDAFMSKISDKEIEDILYNGSSWGALHEKMTGENLSPGLKFHKVEDDDDLSRPWYELLSENETFSNLSLSMPPTSFLVDDAWVNILKKSMEKRGETWLHYLHLGIAAHHRFDLKRSEALYKNAIRLNPNSMHALRGLALLSVQTPSTAWVYYMKAWDALLKYNLTISVKNRFEISLAREIVTFGISQPRSAISLNTLHTFVVSYILKRENLAHDEQLQIAIAYVKLYSDNDFDGVLEYLKKSNVAVSSNLTPVMLVLWQDAQWMKRSASEGGKTLTLLEKVRILRKFPPPLNIDFRGAT
eukprot:g7977.t1